MNDTMHDQLRDRMPEVARGSAVWTAEEAAHLAACEECRHELALIQRALRIGAGVEATFDADAAARAVSARLKAEPALARNRYRPLFLLATAAALALVFARPAATPVAAPVASEVRFLPELDSLTLDELTLVADAFDAPLTETPLIDGPPAADLDTIELQRVLRSLEG